MKYALLVIISIISLNSCSFNNTDNNNSTQYIAYHKNDTAYLTLEKKEDKFFGKLIIKGRGAEIQKGDVDGNIKKNTLVGTYYYLPYKAKEKKRKTFVVMERNDSLIMANGTEQVYMGIPHFVPGTTNYDNPKFIFTRIK